MILFAETAVCGFIQGDKLEDWDSIKPPSLLFAVTISLRSDIAQSNCFFLLFLHKADFLDQVNGYLEMETLVFPGCTGFLSLDCCAVASFLLVD